MPNIEKAVRLIGDVRETLVLMDVQDELLMKLDEAQEALNIPGTATVTEEPPSKENGYRAFLKYSMSHP